MGLPCRRDAHFYIISSTFTPPSSRLQVASKSLAKASKGFETVSTWAQDGAKMVQDASTILHDRFKIAPCWRGSPSPYDVFSVSQQCSFGVLQRLSSNIADEPHHHRRHIHHNQHCRYQYHSRTADSLNLQRVLAKAPFLGVFLKISYPK